MQNKATASVKSLVGKFKTDKEISKAQKIKEDKLKADIERKEEARVIGEKLISRFKHRYFSLDSSNTEVAKVIANIEEYTVLACGEDTGWGENNPLFLAYLSKLSKKFDIKINVRRVKPEDYWSGSGYDMVYCANPYELRVYFKF